MAAREGVRGAIWFLKGGAPMSVGIECRVRIFAYVFAGLLLGSATAGDQVPGAIFAWGDNSFGQCRVPAPNDDFIAMSAGGLHTLGLRSDGSVVAWGQLDQCNVPPPNCEFIAISAGGYHSLGLKLDGSIVQWGEFFGDVPLPNSGYVGIGAGKGHSIALRNDGSVETWGDIPPVPEPNAGFSAVAAGMHHCLALRTDGSIVAWGENGSGQCNVPSSNSNFVGIAGGGPLSLAVKTDGSIVVMGAVDEVPPPNTGFTAVAAGDTHCLALKTDGTVVAWGGNLYHQCDIPKPNAGFVAVSAGAHHSIGMKKVDRPPTADAGANQSVRLGAVVELDGCSSWDDNTPFESLRFYWRFVAVPDGSEATLADPSACSTTFLADVQGKYSIRLTVIDELGQKSAPADVTVSVSTNGAPTANAGSDVVSVIGDAVSLSGAASSDPDGDRLTYQWTLLEMPPGSLAAINGESDVICSLTPDCAGSYILQLRVDDGYGPSNPAFVTVTAITGEEFVETTAAEVLAIVVSLPPQSITTQGNSEAFQQFLHQVVRSVEADDLERARVKLENAIERTDGCALRGTPDANGPGRDWITDCDIQVAIYNQLVAALEALSP